jgi:anti-anti-sigma regulatory factor
MADSMRPRPRTEGRGLRRSRAPRASGLDRDYIGVLYGNGGGTPVTEEAFGVGDAVAVGADAQITDLTVDDHACLTFGEPEELLDLTAAFVRDGLAEGLRVVWVCEQPQEAAAELAPRTNRPGYAGLRVAMDMSWALRPINGIEQLPAFEEEIASEFIGNGAAVLCQYDRDRFDPVTLASVSRFHTHTVAAATYHDDPLLRICRQYAPAGIRLAGQIDHTAQEALTRALTEAVRVDGDLTINLVELTFIDLACARMILEALRSVPPSRKVTLRCGRTIASRFVLLGAPAIPGLRLVTVDDR